MPSVYSILKELSSTTKKNEKLRILETNKDNEDLKRFFYLSLNPFINYFQKKIPTIKLEQIRLEKDLLDLKWGMNRLTALSSREITGNAAIEALKDILGTLSEEDQDVLKRIVLKDPNCGVQETTVNKIWPDLVPNYPVMLCEPYDQKYMDKMVWPALVQRKEDGMRFNAIVRGESIEFRSRKGKLLFLGGLLANDFKKLAAGKEMVFDGELLVVKSSASLRASLIDEASDIVVNGIFPDASTEEKSLWDLEDRATGNGILRKAGVGTISNEEVNRVRAIIWDAIPYEDFNKRVYKVEYNTRFYQLKHDLVILDSSTIKLVETDFVDNFEEANLLFEEYLRNGHEGVIVKNPKGGWEDKRVQHQIKLKAEKECDLLIVGIEEGKKKYTGFCGALMCESSDGIIKVNIGGGLTDKQRKELNSSVIGKIAAIVYNAKTSKKNSDVESLFLARLVEVRDDKSEADSSKEIL